MKASLRRLWGVRSPRERTVIATVTVVLGVASYLWLVQSADRTRGQLKTAVTTLRAQTARLEQQAAELEHLRAAPATPVSQTDLRTLVQAQAGAAGLSRALVRIDAQDANQVQVVFGAIPFADWLAWIGSLQSQQVRLDICRIEALSTAGLVSVTATLTRTKPQ